MDALERFEVMAWFKGLMVARGFPMPYLVPGGVSVGYPPAGRYILSDIRTPVAKTRTCRV